MFYTIQEGGVMSERLYDFTCENCQVTCEKWQKAEDNNQLTCDKCQKQTLKRVFPSPAFKMPRESQHEYSGNGEKIKFCKSGRYNAKTGEIDS